MSVTLKRNVTIFDPPSLVCACPAHYWGRKILSSLVSFMKDTDFTTKPLDFVTNINPSFIRAVILLGLDGRRFIAKYFDEQLATKSKQFEKQLFSRTKALKSKDGILLLDGLVVHKFVRDLHIYAVGAKDESPCLLSNYLNCLAEVISSLDPMHPDYQTRVVSAVVEETVNEMGIIFEPDSQTVLDTIESRAQEETQNNLMRFIGMKS